MSNTGLSGSAQAAPAPEFVPPYLDLKRGQSVIVRIVPFRDGWVHAFAGYHYAPGQERLRCSRMSAGAEHQCLVCEYLGSPHADENIQLMLEGRVDCIINVLLTDPLEEASPQAGGLYRVRSGEPTTDLPARRRRRHLRR